MRKYVASGFMALILALGCAPRFAQIAQAADPPSWNSDPKVRYFYDSLLPYGSWVWQTQYGWCWYPYNISPDWRPYSDGYWLDSDYGWTWMSDYPWGWACFHYGRWFYDDQYGWLWRPDIVWAPAWVIWRTGGDWIGWAPCPPEAYWEADRGFSLIFGDFYNFLPSRSFCFVRRRFFLDHDLRHRIEMRARNVSIIGGTAPRRDSLRMEGGRIVNRLGVERELEKEIGRPIERFRIQKADSPSAGGVVGKEVRFFRPELRREERAAPARQIENYSMPVPQAQNFPAPVRQIENLPAPVQRGENFPTQLLDRQAAESKALEQSQIERARRLENEHAREIENAREEEQRRMLTIQHRNELSAQEELMGQERRLMENWHGRERQMFIAPQAPPQRRFELPMQNSREQWENENANPPVQWNGRRGRR